MSQSNRKWLASLILPVGWLAVASPIRADLIYVDESAGGPVHDGSGWCSAYTDLQDALAAAGVGDEIRVADGVYRPDGGTGDRAATFRLKSQVVLAGGYAGCGAADPDARDVTAFASILSGDLNGDDGPDFANYGDNSYHVVTYDDPNATGVVLDGFTVASGNADGTDAFTNQGGGIHIRQGDIKCIPGGPTIRNCTVEKNWGAHHGAVNDHGLTTVIEDCIVRNNYAGAEGGGLQVHSGAPMIRNCLFEDNESAGNGGGAWVGRDTDATCSGTSTPTVIGCTFRGNTAVHGAGLYSEGSAPVVRDSTFENNTALTTVLNDRRGGGLYMAPGTNAVITECTLSDNTAYLGGGIYIEQSTVSIADCSFDANQAVSSCFFDEAGAFICPGGGGVYATASSDVTLTDCLLDGNRSTREGGAFHANTGATLRAIRCMIRGSDAYYGAGWAKDAALLLAEDCTFEDNTGNHGMTIIRTTATFRRCRFINNRATQRNGGACNIVGGTPFFANCWFEGNQATEEGGAISTLTGLVMANCVFKRNAAPSGGAWVHRGPWQAYAVNSTFSTNTSGQGATLFVKDGGLVYFRNSIIWDGTDSLVGAGGWAQLDYCDVQTDDPGNAVINLDPLLDASMRPAPDSPCIDAGSNALLPPDLTDLDGDGDVTEPTPLDYAGNPRITGGIVDMGAYEMNDCNENGFADAEDIAAGRSEDCTGNGIPDECEPDCNTNGEADSCDIDGGAAGDCNGNGVPDSCDLAGGGSENCNGNNTPDECEADSDGDGTINACDGCPSDPGKTAAGACGCGVPDDDGDGDGVPDCHDVCPGFDDLADSDGDGVADGCDICPAGDDALDCNHNGLSDPCEVLEGVTDDVDGNGVPDDCDIAPVVTADACRALVVTPPAGAEPLALRLTSPQYPCYERFIMPDGGLTGGAMYQSGDVWGTLTVIHEEIVPAVPYAVEAYYEGGTVSAQTWATTAKWGDVVGMTNTDPPDGDVSFRDIGAVVACYKHLTTAPPLYRCDMHPAAPDGDVNFLDIGAAVQGYKHVPYPHPTPEPCP